MALNVTLEKIEKHTDTIETFWFSPEVPVSFIAGQFTQLHLPHTNMDSRGDKRWFTISSSPTDSAISITTKFAAKSSSFKRALRSLMPGSTLTIADPMGDFVLPKDHTIPLLFVAAGMGITPMHSMLSYMEKTGEKRSVHLVHSVSKRSDAIWDTLFASYNMAYSLFVTEEAHSNRSAGPSLNAKAIADWAKADKRQLLYISGPEIMVEKFVKELPILGINEIKLVTDYFPGYEAV